MQLLKPAKLRMSLWDRGLNPRKSLVIPSSLEEVVLKWLRVAWKSKVSSTFLAEEEVFKIPANDKSSSKVDPWWWNPGLLIMISWRSKEGEGLVVQVVPPAAALFPNGAKPLMNWSREDNFGPKPAVPDSPADTWAWWGLLNTPAGDGVLLQLLLAPISAAFCSNAVAEMCGGGGGGGWWKEGRLVGPMLLLLLGLGFEFGWWWLVWVSWKPWKIDDGVVRSMGGPKVGGQASHGGLRLKFCCSFLIENGSSWLALANWDWICWRLMWWETDEREFAAFWIGVVEVLVVFPDMDFALSSARASQKALCVMKLSLLMKEKVHVRKTQFTQ